jgi:hypothetical protein
VAWASVVVAGRCTGDGVSSRGDAAGPRTAAKLTHFCGIGGAGGGGGGGREVVSTEAQGEVGHELLDALMTEVH